MVVDAGAGAVAAGAIARAREAFRATLGPVTLGAKLALIVGIAALAGAGVIVATGGEKILAVILALVGGAALSGFLKARGEQPKADD